MTLAETEPLTADSYQSSGNDAGHQAANPTPVAEAWSPSKRGIVLGVVIAFGMLLVLGFASLNMSPSSELLDMSLLEDLSSSSPIVNFHTCPGTTKTVVVEDEGYFPFEFGKGVYEISILDSPDGPSPLTNTDKISLHHHRKGTNHPRVVYNVEISGDGFHPSVYMKVDDLSDYLHVISETRRASVEISLLCDGDYGEPVGIFDVHGLQPIRTFPFDNRETVVIADDVQPGTHVMARLGLHLRDRHVQVETYVFNTPMMGIGMRDDKNLRDSSGNFLPYEWETTTLPITVHTYLAIH